jgi:hypothetical protein
MIIVWGEHAFAPVTNVAVNKGFAALQVEPISSSLHAAGRARDDYTGTPTLPTLQEVIRQSAQHGPLTVLTPDGSAQSVIGWTVARANSGYGRGIWNALTPSGHEGPNASRH